MMVIVVFYFVSNSQGQYVAAGSGDGSIFIWNVNNAKEVVKKFGKRYARAFLLILISVSHV
jgi:WD40 repeat protein